MDYCFGTFRKDTLSLPYSSPLHCTPKWHALSHKSNICTFRKDTLSLPYSPPPTASQKLHSLSHKSNIRTFRKKDTLSLPYCPPPAHQKLHSLSHKSNIIKPHPTWNNNLSEPFRIILFRNVSERYAFITLLPPTAPKKMMTVLEHFWKIRFRYLTPPPLHPKMKLAIS